jgi:hypothetical protein
MKTSVRLLSAAAAITLGCSPETDEATDLAASATGTLDQRFAAVASRAPAFGGMFVDDDGRLAVHVRGGFAPERALAAIAEVFPDRATAPVRVIDARYGFAQLSAWHGAALDVLALPDVVFTDIDEKRNRVTIGVANTAAMAAAQKELEALAIPREAVIVELTEPIMNMVALRDRVRPLVGGLQIRFSGFLCTLGFNALLGDDSGFVVNSHCTDNESTVDGTLYYQPLNQVPEDFIGTEIADPPFFTSRDNPQACPRGAKCRYSDAAFARLENATQDLGGLARTTGLGSLVIDPNTTFNIIGEEGPRVGDTVNKVGRTTGWTQGTVTNTCVNTGVSGSRIVRLCQEFVSAGVGSGDSGSPVFRIDGGGVQLKGILWGGNSSGTLFVYSGIQQLERDGELGALRTF